MGLVDAETIWVIRIGGYGQFEFVGTEDEAEKLRKSKADWEKAPGQKWRKDLARRSDQVQAAICALWDSGRGVPRSMMQKLHRARCDELSGTVERR